MKKLRPTLKPDEIEKLETEIKNYEKRAQQFQKAGDAAQERLEEKTASIKLRKELKAYNAERVKAGLGWVRIGEFKRMKEEGLIP